MTFFIKESFSNVNFLPNINNAQQSIQDIFAKVLRRLSVKLKFIPRMVRKDMSKKCRKCNKKFKTLSQLLTHAKTHRSNSAQLGSKTAKVLKQRRLPKKLTTRESLKARSRHPNGLKPYSCDKCEKKFARQVYLSKHYTKHTDERPYVCNECGKCFKESSNLINHRKIHVEAKYSCEKCGKKFTLPHQMRRHLRVHTVEKPYACDECTKKFSSSDSLKIHSRIHTGERPFVCDKCGKGFKCLGDLKAHKRVHTDEKPYSCDMKM